MSSLKLKFIQFKFPMELESKSLVKSFNLEKLLSEPELTRVMFESKQVLLTCEV